MAHTSTSPATLIGKQAKLVALAPKNALGIGGGSGGGVLVAGPRRLAKFARRAGN